MIEGVRLIRLQDAEQGEIAIAVITPRDDDRWGVMAPLRGTPWGALIRVVSGEAMSHALHGWATPLMREIGPTPLMLARRITVQEGKCRLFESCPIAGPECRPGKKLPDCYEAPSDSDSVSRLASDIALAWRDGFYVVVVGEGEFNLS